jgi:CelD/BcsL family acetyltransferase involved in cellulose biosynthesis
VTAVQRVDPRTHPLWHDLASGPRGSLFTSPPWITAVSDTYGFLPSSSVVVDESGSPRAGMAWTDVSDMRGRRRLALPFCDRADPIAADGTDWQALAGDALTDDDVPLTLRCLDTSPAVEDPRFTCTGDAAWHTTPLTLPLDELHSAFRPQTRRNIATAERAGVEVILSAEAEAVREYHRLHVELRKRKYRLLAQPREFFDRIWKAFSPADAIRTALAMVDGRPVAGALYLVWQDTVYYKFGASHAEYLPLRPNDTIHWHMIRWAHARGLRMLDWGLSDLDQPGLVRYKRGWASVEGRIRTLNAGGPPRGRRADVEETLSTITDLLTDPSVPQAVTERAGAALYRFFC